MKKKKFKIAFVCKGWFFLQTVGTFHNLTESTLYDSQNSINEISLKHRKNSGEEPQINQKGTIKVRNEKKKLKTIFLRMFWYFEQKLELPESRRKFIAEPMAKNSLQKFQNLRSWSCYLFTRAKMKCTYCLVDGILLLDGVFPSLFAISEDRELFDPFKPKISAN